MNLSMTAKLMIASLWAIAPIFWIADRNQAQSLPPEPVDWKLESSPERLPDFDLLPVFPAINSTLSEQLLPQSAPESPSLARLSGLAAIAPALAVTDTESPLVSVTAAGAAEVVLAQAPVLPEPPEAGGKVPSLSPETPEAQPFRPQFLPLRRRWQVTPSITLLVPSGYGKSWGSAAVGVGFQSRARFTDRTDGSLGVGVGFGNARTAVGLDVGVVVYDLSDFGRGSLNFKLHRLLPEDVAIAAGVINAVTWGEVDGGISPYGVVTKRFQLQEIQSPLSQLYISAGVGGGRFRSELDVFNDVDTVAAFGSVAVRLIEPVNFIAEWSGQDLSLGISLAPFRHLPLVITPLVSDITGNAGDGVRFVLGVGYGFSY